jgi:hypothetical protein
VFRTRRMRSVESILRRDWPVKMQRISPLIGSPQDTLHWPIVVTALCVLALVLFIVAHYGRQAIFTREGSVNL